MKTACQALVSTLALCLLLVACSPPQINYHSSPDTAAPASIPSVPYRWVIQPSFAYDSMVPVFEQRYTGAAAPYLNVFQDNRWGVVNFENGSSIFELEEDNRGYPKGMLLCDWNELHYFPPSIDSRIFSTTQEYDIPLSDYGLPFTTSTICEGDSDYVILRAPGDKLLFCQIGYESLASLTEEEKQTMISKNSTFLFSDVPTDDIDVLFNEYDYTDIGPESQWGIITADGIVLHEANLPAHRYLQETDGIRPYLDNNGKVLYLSPQTGGPVTQTAYDSTLWTYWLKSSSYNAENTLGPGYFAEGLCPVMQNGRVGFMNKQGELVVPLEFEGATHVYQNKAWVKQNGQWGQIEFVL